MFGISYSEFLMILIFLFPLPPSITALLARRKGRRFWPWVGIGFLICISANIVSGILKTRIAPGTPLPELQLIIGALAGPLVTLFLKAAPVKHVEGEIGVSDQGRK